MIRYWNLFHWFSLMVNNIFNFLPYSNFHIVNSEQGPPFWHPWVTFNYTYLKVVKYYGKDTLTASGATFNQVCLNLTTSSEV